MSSPGLPSPSQLIPPRVPLSELLGNFAYATTTTSPRAHTGESTTKKRRIELADEATKPHTTTTKTKSAAKAPRTTKKTQKKPQTITALATKSYQPEISASAPPTVSKLFDISKANTAPDATHDDLEKRAAHAPKKARKPRTKKVKIAVDSDLPSLYTPTQARRQEAAQSFLFGTSSQMALPESPTFIRSIQASITDATPYSSLPEKKSSTRVNTAPHGTALSVGQAEREHWAAAARDWNGGLLRDRLSIPKPNTGAHGKEHSSREVAAAGMFQSRPASFCQHKAGIPTPNTAAHGADHADGEIAAAALSSLRSARPAQAAAAMPISRPARPAQGKISIRAPNTAADGSNHTDGEAAATAMELSPHARLARDKAGIHSPNTAADATAHPRGESSAYINIDDIEDDPPAPPTPSPPRSASPKAVQPLTFDMTETAKTALSSTAMLKPTDAQWRTVKADIFPLITKTVKTCRRSTDPQKPSWWQKILLYDPIVLEEFTGYLNGQGLRISVERVKPKKKGRKPKDTAASEATEIVPEELQAWMVQKWCEEKSICCLWKEGLRGGVRGRY